MGVDLGKEVGHLILLRSKKLFLCAATLRRCSLHVDEKNDGDHIVDAGMYVMLCSVGTIRLGFVDTYTQTSHAAAVLIEHSLSGRVTSLQPEMLAGFHSAYSTVPRLLISLIC